MRVCIRETTRSNMLESFDDIQPGDRIRLIAMGRDPNSGKRDPDPVMPGTRGTVMRLTPWVADGSVIASVDWDNGRTINAVLPIDRLQTVARQRSRYFEIQMEIC